MLRTSFVAVSLVLVGALSLLVAGCGQKSAPTAPSVQVASQASAPSISPGDSSNDTPSKVAPNEDVEHGHKPGEHGGIIISLGRDSYHVEALFEEGDVLRLYMLGQDETRVQEVAEQELVAYVKPEGGTKSVSFKIKPARQSDDSPGKTSQFMGQLPGTLGDQTVDVTIPSIRIGGERFRLGFTSASETHASDLMPEKVSNDAERELYLKPGGLYTEADIEANGKVTASEKFRGFRAAHDLRPKSGDKICPVTLTKANAAVSWIVGGKSYEFCCPPCVDEFVALAKENPEDVREPGEYVKR